ncbi:MAG: ATP-dependent helicase HrpB [Deltaproteobacteria bacterium]|nr:ATP-dependent helicase HrpB [Deltaproteobacteria bacterium]
MSSLQPLPIDSLLPQTLEILQKHSTFILKASPGSGKTTRLPPALLSLLKENQEIWVLVPRRLAAKMAATRMARELGEDVGNTIAYHFRHEKKDSAKTKIRLLTEGMFLRYCLQDPTLKKAGIILLDEFHERHLQSDMALAILKQLQSQKRSDLKLGLLSATLETEALSEYLNHPPIITHSESPHPVEIKYLKDEESKPLEQLVKEAVKFALSDSSGDILVFLPGIYEIRKCEQVLQTHFKTQVKILLLYGDLNFEEQQKVYEEGVIPKIILSTNLAESSITLPKIKTVIDSGLFRQLTFSLNNGLSHLKTKPISKASAIQRAGRAGRTSAGLCLRLYTESNFEGRIDFESPEILRADLSETLLELKSIIGNNVSSLKWLSTPTKIQWESASELLYYLQAIESNALDASLTPIGQKMSSIALHPRLSRFLIQCEKEGILEEGIQLAVLLQEEKLNSIDALQSLQTQTLTGSTQKLAHQIYSNFSISKKHHQSHPLFEEKLSQCLLYAFPDQIYQKREPKQKNSSKIELFSCLGNIASAEIHPIFQFNDYFIVLEAQEVQKNPRLTKEIQIRHVIPITQEQLLLDPAHLLKEEVKLDWDQERLVETDCLLYKELVLEKTKKAPSNTKEACLFLSKHLFGKNFENEIFTLPDFINRLKHYTNVDELNLHFARLKHLKEFSHLSELKEISLNASEWISFLFEHLYSIEEIKKCDWTKRFYKRLPPSVQIEIDQQLPLQFTFQSKRRVKIEYDWNQNPAIESRLQDFFGMTQTPSLLNGRLKLTLRLLAPNFRPVQVTCDLESFWKNTYPQVRKELCRRYPKHAWPENPLLRS